jgi:hypothetical protein
MHTQGILLPLEVSNAQLKELNSCTIDQVSCTAGRLTTWWAHQVRTTMTEPAVEPETATHATTPASKTVSGRCYTMCQDCTHATVLNTMPCGRATPL